MEIIKSEQQTESQMKKNESNIRDLWDNTKHDSLHLIGILEEEEREKRTKNILEEIMAEKLPKPE